MDIISVFFIISVSVAGSAFLGHAIGYRRGKVAGRKEGIRLYRHSLLNSQYGKFAGDLRTDIAKHQDRMGL